MSRYQEVEDEWWAVPKIMDLQCCDCGLVHEVRFRIRFKDKKPVLQMRMARNERATAAVRRERKR